MIYETYPCGAALVEPGKRNRSGTAEGFSLQQIAQLEYRIRWDAPCITVDRSRNVSDRVFRLREKLDVRRPETDD